MGMASDGYPAGWLCWVLEMNCMARIESGSRDVAANSIRLWTPRSWLASAVLQLAWWRKTWHCRELHRQHDELLSCQVWLGEKRTAEHLNGRISPLVQRLTCREANHTRWHKPEKGHSWILLKENFWVGEHFGTLATSCFSLSFLDKFWVYLSLTPFSFQAIYRETKKT